MIEWSFSNRAMDVRHLFLWELAAAGLLGFEVFVQKIQGFLIRLGTAHDGEHALAGIIVRSLGDRDPRSGAPTDLSNLASSSTDDASHHVSRNADVLRLDFLAVLGNQGITTV